MPGSRRLSVLLLAGVFLALCLVREGRANQSAELPVVTAPLPDASKYAVYQVNPVYPLEARINLFEGIGEYIMEIDRGSGNVAKVVMARATGRYALDRAVVAALRKWRFRPHTLERAAYRVIFRMEHRRGFKIRPISPTPAR
jgi:TonB family protein